MKFIISLLIGLNLGFALTTQASTAKFTQKEVVIALKPDKNPDKMQEERKKLESFLSKEIGVPVKVIIPLSASVIQQGFANGTIDLGYLSSMDMIQADAKKTAELLLAGEKNGKTTYESVWLVKKDSPYKSIKDLKGKPVAFASLTSTSGYLTPYAHLIKAGLLKEKQNPEEFFGKSNDFYGTGYTSATQRVFEGHAEAAAVSDYVFFEDKHLSKEEKAQLRVLQKQGPVPTHLIAVRSTVAANDKEILKKALLSLNQKDVSLRDQVFTSKLVESSLQKHLEPLKEYISLTGFSTESK